MKNLRKMSMHLRLRNLNRPNHAFSSAHTRNCPSNACNVYLLYRGWTEAQRESMPWVARPLNSTSQIHQPRRGLRGGHVNVTRVLARRLTALYVCTMSLVRNLETMVLECEPPGGHISIHLIGRDLHRMDCGKGWRTRRFNFALTRK